MRICLIATEIFSHGVYGGFGALTREIAAGLVQRGVEVYVVIPRKKTQKPIEQTENFFIVSYPGYLYTGFKQSLPFSAVFRMIDADIYHSEEPSVGTYLAQKGAPYKKHMITFQDPRTIEDRKREWKEGGIKGIPLLQKEVNYRISNIIINRCVKEAHALYVQAKYATLKAQKIYDLHIVPDFLPNPVNIPERETMKAKNATVCFLGRWDPRKRPEYFFEMAKRFPDVEFIAMGGCSPGYEKREQLLREQFRNVPNLKLQGWTFKEEKSKILESSWILVNTSWRECLPVSYLEACAHKCAILSHENPDNFASEFGYWARQGTLEDFKNGLKWLLEDNRWLTLGERGYLYVNREHKFNKVIDQHLEIYSKLLNQ